MNSVLDLATYGIIVVALLGAIIGSFLNVVVYRLPIGLSIRQPRWSFCPRCEHRIRPYHNIPILSWILLRGRCYDCGVHVPIVYPLVECLTAITFVVVWDALFIAQVLPGVSNPATDWPVALAMGTLFSCLLASSAMDIEAYTIDIRVPLFAVAVAVVCHGLWGLPLDRLAPEAGRKPPPSGLLPPGLCLALVAGGATWLVTAGIGRLFFPPEEYDETASTEKAETAPASELAAETASADEQPESETSAAGTEASEDDTGASHCAQAEPADASEEVAAEAPAKPVRPRFQPIPIILLVGCLLALMHWAVREPETQLWAAMPAGLQRGFLACLMMMIALIMSSKVQREADDEIIEEIEAERDDARRMAIHEFAWFIPAIAATIGVSVLLKSRGEIAFTWTEALTAYADSAAWATHMGGAAHAIACMIAAAVVGWAVRILGTLGLGKEALGTGDIYIMAAIGAAGGAWLAGFGFFIASLLALVGVLVMVFWKANRAIPLGPWLALGALVTLWVMVPLLEWFTPAGQMLWSFVTGEPVRILGY